MARQGGDEFVVVCVDLASAAEAETLVLRVEAAMLPAIRTGATDIFVTASIGVAVTSDGDGFPRDLLRNADTAMYRAKGCGRNRAVFFDEGLRKAALASANMEASLRQAITGGGLLLEYQPVVRIADRCLVGVEALVRMQLPDGRLMPPGRVHPYRGSEWPCRPDGRLG